MAVISNENLNNASVSNEQFGSNDMTWAEADFEWGDGAGTWDNPYPFINEAVNGASITNES